VTVEALQRPGAQGRDLARCRGLFDAGQLDVCMGNYREGRHWLEESLALARELGAEPQANVALHPLCIAALGEGDLAVARRYADEALAIAQSLGDRESVAIGLLNQAIVAVARKDAAGARRLLASVLAIVDETGSRQIAQCLLEVVAGVAALAADWPSVGIFYGAAQAQMRQTGIQRDPADAAALAPHVNESRRVLGAEPFAAAVREGEQRTREAAMDDVRAYLARSG
jgi:hypothetical protein